MTAGAAAVTGPRSRPRRSRRSTIQGRARRIRGCGARAGGRRAATLVSALALGAGLAAPLPAQEAVPLEEAIRQRETRLKELRATRREWEDERRAQLEELDARLAELEAPLAEAEQAAREARERVEALAPEAEAGQAEPGAALLAELASQAIPVVEALRERIARGIPHRRDDRSARVAGILEDLRATDPLLQGEALEALAAFAEEELRLAGSVELENAPVPLEDGARRVHAWLLRLGLASEFLVSEDGETLGVASGRKTPAWRLELTPEERAAVRHAVAVLQGRERPGLRALPFPHTGAPAGSGATQTRDEETRDAPAPAPDGPEASGS